MSLRQADIAALKAAKHTLEHPGLAAKLSNLLGTPVERGFAMLPAGWRERLYAATQEALMAALKGALLTLDGQYRPPRPRWHKFAAALSGGVGGAIGLPALIVELPLSTTIMLRSIADIARAEGEDLTQPAARLACLEVLALGAASPDQGADAGYFAARTALARTVAEASEYLAEKALVEDGAPALARLLAKVALRFQLPISEKAAAMAVPIIGAMGGAGINLLFVDHFQNMSRAHFVIRRLERTHGEMLIRAAYDAL